MPTAIAILLYAIILFAPPVLNDGDTWSHIAVGQWIIQHHAVPWTDPFSLTRASAPWLAHEWLAELLMAIAWRIGGVSLVLVLTAAAAALAAGLLVLHLRRWLPPLAAAVTFLFAGACGAADLLARPHILAVPALELWTAGLLIARSRGAAPSIWLLPIMALWANLHGSFAFGLALVPPLALEAWLADRRRRTLRAWGLFLAAAIAAAAATPYGWQGLAFPPQLLALRHLGNIGEWRSQDFSSLPPLEFALMALLYVCLSRGVRLPPVRLVLILGLLHMALQHRRYGLIAAVAAPLILAEPLAHALKLHAAGRVRIALGRAARLIPAAATLAIAVLTALRVAHPATIPDGPTAPVAALRQLPPELRTAPVFNDYAFGGLLIFDGIRPFIDARAELYGDDGLARYLRIIRPDRVALEEALQRWRIAWTLLPPSSPCVALLDLMPGWRRAYADEFGVVHIRTGSVN